jgi:surface antigen
MKQVAMKALVLLTLIGLVGCSSNTQSTNTGIGAATGAVVGGLAGTLFGQGTGKAVAVGVGAVAGAILGGYIGHGMDNSDKAQCNQTLSTHSANKPARWKNDKTGTSYTMTPTSEMITYKGNPNCRQYTTQSVTSDGAVHNTNNIACRQSNGAWMNM